MKILYNVTINIDKNVLEEWKAWMINFHIPDVMATGKFESFMMQRILSGESEGGVTFAIQYLAHDRKSFDEYQLDHAPRLQKEHTEKYNGKFGAFRTIMEVVSEGRV